MKRRTFIMSAAAASTSVPLKAASAIRLPIMLPAGTELLAPSNRVHAKFVCADGSMRCVSTYGTVKEVFGRHLRDGWTLEWIDFLDHDVKMHIDWIEDCLREWDTILEGEHRHWCPDWDMLPIDETRREYEVCTCFAGMKVPVGTRLPKLDKDQG